MEKFVVKGGKPLRGRVKLSGSKNIGIKIPVLSLLTAEEIEVHNVPLISSFYGTLDVVEKLGSKVTLKDHTVKIRTPKLKDYKTPIEMGAVLRTASMVAGPLLARFGKAVVPNPGGCRLGARPIDRHIEGLKRMGASVNYKEGLFLCEAKQGLSGTNYTFEKNTHTGTETLIFAAALAKGRTVLENAAQEPEIDDLINILNLMGGKINRIKPRTIIIEGVRALKGATYSILPDRNEAVTFACAAIATHGDILIEDRDKLHIDAFLEALKDANIPWKEEDGGIRFIHNGQIKPTDIQTQPHPGFMTDWQAPWVTLMTQAKGTSVLHETIYESRFAYVNELNKMGADIELFNPKVHNPQKFYNFNWQDNKPEYFHAAKITGPKKLHDAVLTITDLRAGATLIIAALIASGTSTLYGIDHIDRGYENFEKRLKSLGADIQRVKE